MTLTELIGSAKVWCAADHTGEMQHGHHGRYMGQDNQGHGLFVSAQEGGTVWINIQDPTFDEEGYRTLSPEVLECIRNTFKATGLGTLDGWACRTHGHPAWSWVGRGWEVHPTTIELCRSVGLDEKLKVIGKE